MPETQKEYRVVVPWTRFVENGTQIIYGPSAEDDGLGKDYTPDAEACSIIGPDADSMTGTAGLAMVTLLEWRAEDPQRRQQGHVEVREVTAWEAVPCPGG